MNQAMMNHNHATKTAAAPVMKSDEVDALYLGAPAARRPLLRRPATGNSTGTTQPQPVCDSARWK